MYQRQGFSGNFLSGLPPTGQATKVLCLASLLVSVFGAVFQRKFGFGVNDLVFSVPAVLNGEFWRVGSYIFVERTPFGLFLGLLVFWLFARSFESKWGAQDFTRFVLVSGVGAALISIPLSFIVSSLFSISDAGYADGFGAVIDAFLVHMAITTPNSQILFGFMLPLNIRTAILIVLGIELLSALQTGSSGVSVTLGGMAMGYLLTTGMWKPSFLLSRFKAKRSRKTKFYVVPQNDDHRMN